MSALRLSPLHDQLHALHPVWGAHNDMLVAVHLPSSSRSIELCDLSVLNRMGLKGPAAADWLAANGIGLALRANSWLALDHGGLVARLGRSEFLIEDGWHGDTALVLREKLGPGTAGVYPVERQDAAVLMRGPAVHELFAQTCNIDLESIPPQDRMVTLTMMAGVAVTIISSSLDDDAYYRIWCDGTYGAYLWDTLLAIAVELGGCAVGADTIFPEASATQPVQI